MAWLMIYGLLAATLLTLYIVPSLYAIIVETFGVKPITIPVVAESTSPLE